MRRRAVETSLGRKGGKWMIKGKVLLSYTWREEEGEGEEAVISLKWPI